MQLGENLNKLILLEGYTEIKWTKCAKETLDMLEWSFAYVKEE